MIALLLVATAPFFALPPKGYDRITPQVAAQRVAACGVGSVTVRNDAESASDVLVLAATGPISEAMLSCIDKAAGFYDVELPPAAQVRIDAIRRARMTSRMVAESKKWLAAHNLLGRLPTYVRGVTMDATFARQIETLCNAKGALSSRFGIHALSPRWAIESSKGKNPTDDDAMTCLLSATSAVGYELAFVGNAKVSP